MMTSRAEYRLLLRQDNADLRLSKKGYEIGLISQERYDWVCQKEVLIQKEIERVAGVKIGANKEVQALFGKLRKYSVKYRNNFNRTDPADLNLIMKN